jgi:hypothetical protein
MAVDASKLKRRRSLGAPPTEGAPGIEEGAPQTEKPLAARPTPGMQRFAETSERQPAGIPEPAAERSQPGVPAPVAEIASAEPDRAGGRGRAIEPEPQAEPVPVRRGAAAAARGRGGGAATPVRRQRVPAPEAEPRVPFTTRIAASTKERLEDACYHLRMKHQAFIDEAIRIHLEKQGF